MTGSVQTPCSSSLKVARALSWTAWYERSTHYLPLALRGRACCVVATIHTAHRMGGSCSRQIFIGWWSEHVPFHFIRTGGLIGSWR